MNILLSRCHTSFYILKTPKAFTTGKKNQTQIVLNTGTCLYSSIHVHVPVCTAQYMFMYVHVISLLCFLYNDQWYTCITCEIISSCTFVTGLDNISSTRVSAWGSESSRGQVPGVNLWIRSPQLSRTRGEGLSPWAASNKDLKTGSSSPRSF